MVANISKSPVNKTPEKGKENANENATAAAISSPIAQLIRYDGSDDNDQSKGGSLGLKNVQFFGKFEIPQNKPSSSKQLQSSPSFPPIQRKGSTDHSPKAASAKNNKTGLPDGLKSGVEALSGISLGDVKVHYNSSAPAQLHAHAYAQGTNIHVAPGQEKHLPHEAWHVVQQKQGRVQATKQMKGKVPVNDDAGLESEADVMGAKAVQMAAKENGGVVQQISASNNAVAQLGIISSIKSGMKSMYNGVKRMFGFGGEDKKDEKVGVGTTDVDVIPEVKENKHNLFTLRKYPERFNKEEKNEIINSKMNADKDLEIIPKGKVEETKKAKKNYIENHINSKAWKTEKNKKKIDDSYDEKIKDKLTKRNQETINEHLPFNPAIEDTEPAKVEDGNIIPKGKVEGIKNGIVVAGGEKGEAENDRKNDLEKHFKEKIRHQALVSVSITKKKHGQGMAEQIAKGGDGNNENVDNFTNHEEVGDKAISKQREAMSQNLMGLVSLTKYDDTASASVLELANEGTDLSDQVMWNLIVVNSKFMSYIKEGMTVNKIIPDDTVEHVIKYKHTSYDRDDNETDYDKKRKVTKIAGSVAHEMNYNQGLTGEESIANFGLDYSGYEAGTLNHDGTKEAKGELSSYVYKTEKDEKGRTLKAVPNVFYMKVAIPAVNLPGVKVPVHQNVQNWANNKLNEIKRIMGNQNELSLLAESLGDPKKKSESLKEMSESLTKKLAILNLFIERSKVDEYMLTTLTADMKKNKEDPLTNMGMTKPSSRLQTEFGTINQEYHIGLFDVPEGSGLWLKDATGIDTLVGQLVPNPKNSNLVEWGSLNEDLMKQKLKENSDLRSKK